MKENELYTESLVAFLDILGFSDAINAAQADQAATQSIAHALDKVQERAAFIEKGAKGAWQMDFRVLAFSDSIVISCPQISEQSFIYMAHIIAAIQMDMMQLQFFIRGAISAGAHYEKEHVFFGPAFIRAHELEKQSVWPRIIVDTVVLQKLNQGAVQKAVESYLLQDQSGIYYFNYLHLVFALDSLQLEEEVKKSKNKWVDLTRIFQQHKQYLLEAVDKIKVTKPYDLLPKYHAVASYHNQYIKELCEDLPITENYEDVDPNTTLGKLVSIYETYASSKQGVEVKDIRSYLQELTKALYKQRDSLKACEIDLSGVFGPLYPHISNIA